LSMSQVEKASLAIACGQLMSRLIDDLQVVRVENKASATWFGFTNFCVPTDQHLPALYDGPVC
jgi:hypothetical protein